MKSLEDLLITYLNQFYHQSTRIYPAIPYILITNTIIFIFLYTYHSLYRVNRKLFLNKDAEYAFDKDRNIPKIVFYSTAIVVIITIYILYYFFQRSYPELLKYFYLGLCPAIFILAIVGFFMFQSRIITFADSKDMKGGILACAIFIFITLFLLYFSQSNKIEYNDTIMYIFGFLTVFFMIQFLYLISTGNTLMIQMREDRFDTLAKICLLGKGKSVEERPYKKSVKTNMEKECNCNPESFTCLFETWGEHFENATKQGESKTTSNDPIPQKPQQSFVVGGRAEDLKYEDGIPVSYYNNDTQQYEDLYIRDFYYLGSYYSYLAGSPASSPPDLNALKDVVKDFKCRILHLDIDYDPVERVPIAKNPKSPESGTLKLDVCFDMISKYAWSDYGEKSLPLFLYLRFNETSPKKELYQKTYGYIEEYFGAYLANMVYGFNERNHLFPVSKMPIRDALGRVIILTNIYPTYTILDEVIHCNVEDPLSSIKMKEFKKEYATYDKQGLLIDSTAKDLIEANRNGMTFYYTLPNESYDGADESKAGLFNPNFYEIAKYGAQSALLYVYLPDSNHVDIRKFFEETSTKGVILKDPSLRKLHGKSVKSVESSAADLTPPTETISAMNELISYNPTFT